jgi:hypothetical protein
MVSAIPITNVDSLRELILLAFWYIFGLLGNARKRNVVFRFTQLHSPKYYWKTFVSEVEDDGIFFLFISEIRKYWLFIILVGN